MNINYVSVAILAQRVTHKVHSISGQGSAVMGDPTTSVCWKRDGILPNNDTCSIDWKAWHHEAAGGQVFWDLKPPMEDAHKNFTKEFIIGYFFNRNSDAVKAAFKFFGSEFNYHAVIPSMQAVTSGKIQLPVSVAPFLKSTWSCTTSALLILLGWMAHAKHKHAQMKEISNILETFASVAISGAFSIKEQVQNIASVVQMACNVGPLTDGCCTHLTFVVSSLDNMPLAGFGAITAAFEALQVGGESVFECPAVRRLRRDLVRRIRLPPTL